MCRVWSGDEEQEQDDGLHCLKRFVAFSYRADHLCPISYSHRAKLLCPILTGQFFCVRFSQGNIFVSSRIQLAPHARRGAVPMEVSEWVPAV